MSDEEQLATRIVENPDDNDTWLVLADLLQKRGDPHGELIALQVAADRKPLAKPGTAAQTTFAKAFAKHAAKLLGPLAKRGASTKDPWAEPFVWKTGFLRRAVLDDMPTSTGKSLPIDAVLGELFALPAARFLTELVVRAHPDSVVARIAHGAPPTLVELDLLVRSHVESTAALWRKLPQLRRISISAHRLVIDELALPEARRAAFNTIVFEAGSMAAVAAAPWPYLERLELRVGYDDGGAFAGELSRALDDPTYIEDARRRPPATFEDVAPLLVRTDMPALTHLRIRKAPFAGGVLRALVDAPLARQLQVLDLSGGTLTPQDIAYASQRKAAFANLRELWVPPLDQWSGVSKHLEGMAKHVITRAPLDLLDR